MTSVAVVVLDTLRRDAFDRHFDWLPGRRFAHAFSTGDWTVPAHASLFTGRYPSEVGVHAKSPRFDCADHALAERLREAGYETRAYSANPSVTGHLGFDRGFSDFRVPPAYRAPGNDIFDWRRFNRTTGRTGARKYLAGIYECVAGDYDTVTSLLAGAKLKLRHGRAVAYGGTIEAQEAVAEMPFDDREFLFLNLMEAHEPYAAPSSYATVEEPPLTDSVGDLSMGEVDGDLVRRAYDDCVRYLSDVYGELFSGLRAEFDYVITLSDHGEMLGEGGAFGHEYGLYPELTHVPLVVSGEGFDGEPACDAPVSLVDVHATVLDLAGLPTDGRGRSLAGRVRDGEDAEFLTEYHGLTAWSERKLKRHGYAGEVERYDAPLLGYVGPGGCYAYETPAGFEATSCVGVDGAEDPRARLDALVNELDVRRVEEDGSVPEDIKEQLEHLGYA